jgi:multidrug efflux system membrane fusion protein
VVNLPAAEGRLVKKGDVVCELALEDRQLRFRQAQSAVAQAQLEYDGSLKLKSGGYQSRTAIAAAKAKLDSALADQRSRELDLANTKIRAPFDGLIERHAVDEGAFVKRGQECATLIDLDPLMVTGRVSEKEVDGLAKGAQALVSLRSNDLVRGRVSLVGSESDEVTRTFRVEVEVDNSDHRLRSGISADVVVGTGNIRAHLLSPALLSLDDSGRVGLRILNEQNQVAFVYVELVGDHKQGVWVTGLPEQSLVITLGQEYVSHGETVAVELENALADLVPVPDVTASAPPKGSVEPTESAQR